jgi:hypothetical protein
MTSPTPQIPGLAGQVADLERRIRALEGRPGAAPGATGVPVSAWPYNAGALSTWPTTSSTEWASLWFGTCVLEWKQLDLYARQYLSDEAAGQGQLRLLLDDTTTIWTGAPGPAAWVGGQADLSARVADDSQKGTRRLITLQGRVTAGTGSLSVMLSRLLMTGPVW